MAQLAIAAAVVEGVSSVIGGISANEQAKAQSKSIQRQSFLDEQITRADFQRASGAQIAQAGGTGLSLTGGSFLDIFTENALNEAKTISDIKFQGAVDSANVRQQGKNALIGGILGGVGQAVGGISSAKFKKQQLQTQRSAVTSRATRRAAAPRGRSLLGPQG